MDGIDIDETLVRSLLNEQHPDLAELALGEVDGGWDNRMWRLGETRRSCGPEVGPRCAA